MVSMGDPRSSATAVLVFAGGVRKSSLPHFIGGKTRNKERVEAQRSTQLRAQAGRKLHTRLREARIPRLVIRMHCIG